MRSLLEVLFRYGGFWTFLLLEGLSIYLVVQFNQHQRAIAFASLNRFSGWVDQTSHSMQTFLRTRIYADSLAAENARLRRQLLEFQMRYPPRTIRVESEEPAQAFQMQAARVLHNSIHRHHNYLILDKGSRQGVEPHSAVVVDEGIVGIVRQVSERHCLVMSVLNRQARISAGIKGKGYFGTLRWVGTDPRHMLLSEVPAHALIEPGDTVVTTGFSAIFPSGWPIGWVDSTWVPPGSFSQNLGVSLSADLTALQYVYIVKNLHKKELEALEQNLPNE